MFVLCLIFPDTFKRNDDDKRRNPRGQKLEQILSSKLSEFLESDISYSMRRVMAAELQHLYRGPNQGRQRLVIP